MGLVSEMKRRSTRQQRPDDFSHDRQNQSGSETEGRVYGLIPVIEALRAGKRQIEQVTIAEGSRDARLKELIELARQSGVPVHRVPRIEFDRAMGGARHQGIVARIAAARYHDAAELLDA